MEAANSITKTEKENFVLYLIRSIAGPGFSGAEAAFITIACIAFGVLFALYSDLGFGNK